MCRLDIHADDYALSPNTSEDILQCLRAGIKQRQCPYQYDLLQGICGEISKGEGCMAAAAAADGAS